MCFTPEIIGCIKMKSQLSGMPELRLGLNDRVQFDSGNGGGARGGAGLLLYK